MAIKLKSVRFADDDLSTPSPTFSSLTLSTPGPLTPPPPLNYTRSPYACTPLPAIDLDAPLDVHPVLALPTYLFDLSYDPAATLSSCATLPPHILCQSATTRPLSCITILSKHLPWKLEIMPSSSQVGAFVTVADVLGGLYRALRLPVRPVEYKNEPAPRRMLLAEAFNHRCEGLKHMGASVVLQEHNKGMKRVDFLMQNHRFKGLSPTDRGAVWRLNVSS